MKIQTALTCLLLFTPALMNPDTKPTRDESLDLATEKPSSKKEKLNDSSKDAPDTSLEVQEIEEMEIELPAEKQESKTEQSESDADKKDDSSDKSETADESKEKKKPKKDEPKKVTEEDFDKVVYSWMRTYTEVIDLVKTKHYRIDTLETAFIKSIECFLSALDPHSSLLDPKTYKMMLESTSGEFYGIGVVIDNTRKTKDRFLLIVDTIPDGPSDKEGIKPLDKIVEVNGETIEGMTTEESITNIKGKKGSTVELKVTREGQSEMLSFEITRDVVKEQNSLSFEIKNHNIYYLSLNQFTENAIKQVEDLLKKAADKQYKGIILDLRNNSGGLLKSAIEIAGLFIEQGSLVVETKDRSKTQIERYYTERPPVADGKVPIFVLINNYTASAAEILAGCLKQHADSEKNQERSQVFLVGTRTFGKGSVQEVIPISNNCACKITTALYFLPGDISIQGVGIEPDFHIERAFPPTEQVKWFTEHYGRENTLDGYIKVHDTGDDKKAKAQKKKDKKDKEKNSATRWSERAKEMLEKDNQVRTTITLIETLAAAPNKKETETRKDSIKFLQKHLIKDDHLELVEIKTR